MNVRDLIRELISFNLDAEIGINDNGTLRDITFGWSSGDDDVSEDERNIENEKLEAQHISLYAGDTLNENK